MILWIDYWTKYIWLAKKDKNNFIMPIWYIINDWNLLFGLSEIIERYKINSIVIWWPTKQKNIQEKIDNFIKEINIIYPKISIKKIDEDYTSIEASAKMGNFWKNKWKEDTIAAMKILERL